VSDDLLIEAALEETRDKMQRAIEHAKGEFSTIRTGRATSALVERIRVEYFDSEVPLQQLAGFSVPDARTLVINPYDKGAIKAIEKAIGASDLGVNPSEERRRDLVKVARQRAEDGRVAVRNVRRQTRHELDALEREGEISSDDLERAEKALEAITHEFVAEVDRLVHHKEQELLEV
jgi:ribosome recycling factor